MKTPYEEELSFYIDQIIATSAKIQNLKDIDNESYKSIINKLFGKLSKYKNHIINMFNRYKSIETTAIDRYEMQQMTQENTSH